MLFAVLCIQRVYAMRKFAVLCAKLLFFYWLLQLFVYKKSVSYELFYG